MLLRAEDGAKFSAEIIEEDADVLATYFIEGTVKGEIVSQSDRRVFASEQEARAWLIGEADKRGFPGFKPSVKAAH